ncbi:YciI family protein [Actinoplanes sp. NPDC049265]|uniref:YciI family protein n=1 Tax=Actinoplanes sp. NPDC049265 TaxID=3363902 RepID=UPI003715ACA7
MPKYLLIQNYEGGRGCDTPMGEWDPADIRAHIDFQVALDAELTAAGELIDSQGVGQAVTVVVSDGATTEATPAAVEGRLAGFRLVDVVSADRAVEIAARCSAAPARAGRPIQQPVEVREVMVAP